MKSPPFRFWIGIMVFFTTFTNYMLRANISVGIIKMVGKHNEEHIPPCKRDESGNTTVNKTATPSKKQDPVFDWTESEVERILTGYFYGYLVSLIPGGFLSELIGPWHVIMWSSVASTVLTGLTPVSTLGGPYGVMANRIFIGIFGGVVYPSLNTLVANWAPPNEKGKFMAAMMGNNIGTIFSFNIVGLVTDYWGWTYSFYVVVIIMGVFSIFFCLFVADSPNKSKWTSKEECDYILEMQEGHLSKKKAVAPYLKMLTSVPFLAVCTAQFGNAWGLNLILTYAPKFMANTLGFNIKASAGLASLPYLARMACSATFGVIGDYLRKKKVMTVTRLRKFFIIFSHFIPAACLFLVRAGGCNAVVVVILLIVNQGFNGAIVVSHFVNPQDLTPNFAASCFGVMNTLGMTTGIFVPEITGALNSYYNRELKAAALIFMIGGIVFTVTGMVFILFGSGNVQPWNEIKDKEGTASQEQEGRENK